ncbi:MAG: glutathione synthase [Betaproteobacteria bacterium]|nr:glutathione synthase [Betaproteobacteria bacterium]
MKLAFIVDPLAQLKAYKDSSVAMMRAAQARGHEVFAILRDDLRLRDGAVRARAAHLSINADEHAWYRETEALDADLREFDAVLMRQDPPFDFEYVAATWMLERAQQQGARIYNDPRAIRDHSEKLAITEFPQFTAPTLVARAAEDLNAFIDEFGEVVLKPLDGMGGAGVFRVRHDDPNRYAIIEAVGQMGTRSVMAQRYIPEIANGDKRILVVAGEVMPYSLARIPRAGESRGNLAAGGRGEARPLSERDRAIGEALAPMLWQRGLLIVGLDVIGDYLTEVNVTSPTCMVEIQQQTGFNVAERVIAALERRSD